MNYMDDILARQMHMQQNMPKKDPFDQGIMRAVKSAKQSLDMDDEQSDRAMRESMATFADNIAPMPKVKGFMANFAQVGRALSPAIQTHDAYEDQAKEKNKQMIAYAQQLRAAEEAKAAALEGNAYSREMADKQMAFQQQQLAEQREHHKLLADIARAKAEAKITGTPPIYAKELVKNNIKSLSDQKDQSIKAKARYDVIKDYGNVLFDAKEKGLTGTDIVSGLRRKLAKDIFDDSEELTLNDMLKQAYISRTKELGGSNPSTVEVQLAFATIPGIEKNYEASLKQLERDMNESLAIIDNYNKFRDKMEQTKFQGFPDEIGYDKKPVSIKYFDPNDPNDPNKVEMIDEDGISYFFPQEEYNYAIKEGFRDKKKLDAQRKKLDEQPRIFGMPLITPDPDKGIRGSILPLFPKQKNNLENKNRLPLFSKFKGS